MSPEAGSSPAGHQVPGIRRLQRVSAAASVDGSTECTEGGQHGGLTGRRSAFDSTVARAFLCGVAWVPGLCVSPATGCDLCRVYPASGPVTPVELQVTADTVTTEFSNMQVFLQVFSCFFHLFGNPNVSGSTERIKMLHQRGIYHKCGMRRQSSAALS